MEKKHTKFRTREELKGSFKNGNIPTGKNYADLIESMMHKFDDGISKDEKGGLNIHCSEESDTLVSFHPDLNSPVPFFRISRDQAVPRSLMLYPYNDQVNIPESKAFFFGMKGNLGVGKRCDDNLKLEVKGFTGMEGRTGTYQHPLVDSDGTFKPGIVDADGEWHTIIDRQDNCKGYEIIARTGKKHKGRFAMLHAIALSTFCGRGRIRKTHAYYGFFWNKLNIRWRGTTHNYCLQIRTNRNYGDNTKIHYRITKLWEDELFVSEDEFYRHA